MAVVFGTAMCKGMKVALEWGRVKTWPLIWHGDVLRNEGCIGVGAGYNMADGLARRCVKE